MTRLQPFLQSLRRDQHGGAAVEFGLIAPLLIAVVIGMSTVGGEIFERHEMRRAVSSGAQLLMATDADAEAVRDVTLDAWPGKTDGATVQVTQWCRCGAAQHSCSTTCSDGDYPEMYTRIDASSPYTGPLGQETLSSSQVVRTR